MYNHDIKKLYIDYKEKTTIINRIFLESIFERTTSYEEKLNKDLCMFTFVDISNMYKLWNISSANTLSTINTVFISYTTFCINRGLVRDCQNHFQEFKRDELNACLNKLIQKMQIVTKDELLTAIINLEPRDQYAMLALFEFGRGNKYEDIYKLHLEDVDIQNKKAKLTSGRVVMLSDALINIILKSANTYEYETSTRVLSLIDSSGHIDVFKSCYNRPATRNSAYISITKSLSHINNVVTPNSIIDSGRIDFVKKRTKETKLTPKEYLIQYQDEIINQYGAKIVPSFFIRQFDDYL